MLTTIFRSIFGTKHERDVKRMRPVVETINALEPAMQALSDVELRGKTDELRKRLADTDDLEALLPEAFAACREAARRTVHMRHFDVQLMGGMVLHEGRVAEMKTGEGKTLVATLPVYLNALTGRGVHVVTVNDYLAKRDAAWMGAIYKFLGLAVGVIVLNGGSLANEATGTGGGGSRRPRTGRGGRRHSRHRPRWLRPPLLPLVRRYDRVTPAGITLATTLGDGHRAMARRDAEVHAEVHPPGLSPRQRPLVARTGRGCRRLGQRVHRSRGL